MRRRPQAHASKQLCQTELTKIEDGTKIPDTMKEENILVR